MHLRTRFGELPWKGGDRLGEYGQRKRNVPHKRAGTVGGRDSPKSLFKESHKENGSYSNGQHDSFILPDPQRGDKVQNPDRDIQKDMEFFVPEGDHDYYIMDPLKRKQDSRLTHSSTVARSTLVLNDSGNANCDSSLPPSEKELTIKSHEIVSPSRGKEIPSSSGISSIREQYENKGFSKSASEIMLHARRESTTSAYKTRWNKWVLWSNERQVDPFTAPVNQVVEFLSELYQEGLEYRTINVYRSAISAYHCMVNGSPIDKAKVVSFTGRD